MDSNRIGRPPMPGRSATVIPQPQQLARIKEEREDGVEPTRYPRPAIPAARMLLDNVFSANASSNVRLRTYQRHDLMENMRNVLERLDQVEAELRALRELYLSKHPPTQDRDADVEPTKHKPD